MIRIIFTEPNTQQWLAWRKECQEKTEETLLAVRAGGKPTIGDLYKDKRMKDVYFNGDRPFFGKCAYCETRIHSNQPGDVEHFRPANRVTEIDGTKPTVTIDGHTELHPGYYWLALDWRNLLPACADCNRPTSSKTGGTLVGKWDKFPVRGKRATAPGEEAEEEPLLLNPMWDDPEVHLGIDLLGLMHGKSDRGETCIKVFGFNLREGLVKDRREAIEIARDTARLWLIAVAMGSDGQRASQLAKLGAISGGSVPHAMAARFAMRIILADYSHQMSVARKMAAVDGADE